MNTDDWHDLIQRHMAGLLDDEEAAAFQDALKTEAELRKLYLHYMTLDVALESHASSAKTTRTLLMTPSVRVERLAFSWFQWRPLTAAAAGLVFGLFCASVAWAYTSPRVMAEVRRVSALVDASFEKQPGRVTAGFPREAGVWSGDEAEVVSRDGATSKDGRQVLRFVRAGGEASNPSSPVEACDVYQIVDLRTLKGELKGAGESMLELSAEFLDARTEESVPAVFSCHVYLFEGSVESLQEVWPPTVGDTLGAGAGYILSSGGPDAGGWRKVTARCVVSPDADVAVVKLSAGRVGRHGVMPELGKQFADDVKLVLMTQPVLPVRVVQHP